MTKQYSLN